MNTNLAYQEEPREELLNGKIFMMSSPSMNHNRISGNIYHAFRIYLHGKSCDAFGDGVDVYLTEEDRVIPDVLIVCNPDIIKKDGVYGAPDLIVEILSPSTAKNDRGYKRKLYEKSGVKEYWIIDPVLRSIEAYLLEGGEYQLDNIYRLPDDDMTDQEKRNCQEDIPVSLYDDFSIPLSEIFHKVL